jgi:hypothetical protein
MRKGLLLLLIVLAFTAFRLETRAAITDNLVGYWPFDETQGSIATDASGHGAGGTLVNMPADNSQWVAGQIGGGLHFRGLAFSDYVRVDSFTRPTTTMTISAWVWADSAPPWAVIANNWDSTTGPFSWTMYGAGGNLGVYLTDASGIIVSHGEDTGLLTLGVWHHVAFVADGGTVIRMWRDGSFVSGFNYNSTIMTNPDKPPLEIGGRTKANPGQSYWDGKIDDVGLWTRALSQSELLAIYNAGLSGNPLIPATTTAVTSSPAPTVFGQTVTFAATIAPAVSGGGSPSGTVTFAIAGGPTLTGTLNASGTATVTTSALSVGSHSTTATYSGDADFNGSSGTVTHQVNQSGTTTTVTSSPAPSVYGDSVTFTATVVSVAPGAGTPTGTVTFAVVPALQLFSATLDASGVATVTTSTLSAGSYTVVATYNADSNFSGSAGTDTQTVTRRNLNVIGIIANDKTYDGTTAANLILSGAALVGVMSGDDVVLNTGSVAGTFADKNIGITKSVTVSGLAISGAGANNYTLIPPAPTANITPKAVTVANITASDKTYDANTTAMLDLSSTTLVGVITGETVILNTASASGAFANKSVGTAKTVSISGLAITGASAGNYLLTQPSTTARISAATVTVAGVTANDKVYDGNTIAALNLSAAAAIGVMPGDIAILDTTLAHGMFENKNVGPGKAVSVAGLAPSGSDAGNYAIIQPAAVAGITVKNLTIAGATVDERVYDETTIATLNFSAAALVGVVSGDVVTLVTNSAVGSFADAVAGSGKPVPISGLSLSGSDSINYSLTQPTLSGKIVPLEIVVTAFPETKIEGQSDPVFGFRWSQSIGPVMAGFADFAGALSRDPGEVPGQYRINLGTLSSSNFGISFEAAYLTIERRNTAPSALNDRYTTQQDESLDVTPPGLLANDSDANNDSLTAILEAGPTHGALTLNPDGSFRYIPQNAFHGLDSFTYRAVDRRTNSAPATVQISVSKKPEPLTLLLASEVTHTLGMPATLLDTNAIARGDNAGGGTLNIKISTNAVPGDVLGLRHEGNETGQIAIAGNAIAFSGTTFGERMQDPENTSKLLIQLHSNATVLAVQALARNLVFATTNRTLETRVVELLSASSAGEKGSTSIRVVINRPPTVQSINETAAHDTITILAVDSVLIKSSDPDGDSIVILEVSANSSQGGQVTMDGSAITYRPAAGFTGIDGINYIVGDGRGGQQTGTIALQVLATGQLVAINLGRGPVDLQNAIELRAGAIPGRTYEILVSSNLIDWQVLATMTATSEGLLKFVDEESRRNPVRFYRTRSQ